MRLHSDFGVRFNSLLAASDRLLPFLGLGGAIHHDLHHEWPRTNFQPFFTWADALFQTDFRCSPEGLKAAAKKKENQKNSAVKAQ
jgi:sterol desaturase/sphingolipid hydroxylase (fatty acid hydroxylase superfamily)